MAAIRDEALILRRFSFGETSLVVQVLTREHGRVHLIARGAYRPKSRYYAVLDLFDTLRLEWSHADGRDLQNLREAEIATRRAGIARSLAAYRAGNAALELCALGARLGQPAPELFALQERVLDALAAPDARPEAALAVFELRFLHALGLSPALLRCASCDGPAPAVAAADAEAERAAFSAGAGGRLCRACAAQARASGRRVGTLPVAVLEQAAKLFQEGAGGAVARTLPEPALERVRDFVARFLEYHVESRPRSYGEFLSVPNRNRPSA